MEKYKKHASLLPPVNDSELPSFIIDLNLINQHFLNIPSTRDFPLSYNGFYNQNRFIDATLTLKSVISSVVGLKTPPSMKSNDNPTLVMYVLSQQIYLLA